MRPPKKKTTARQPPFPIKVKETPSTSEICPICHDSLLVDEPVTVVNCGYKHRFHTRCIRGWSLKHTSRNMTCPMCRKTITMEKSAHTRMTNQTLATLNFASRKMKLYQRNANISERNQLLTLNNMNNLIKKNIKAWNQEVENQLNSSSTTTCPMSRKTITMKKSAHTRMKNQTLATLNFASRKMKLYQRNANISERNQLLTLNKMNNLINKNIKAWNQEVENQLNS